MLNRRMTVIAAVTVLLTSTGLYPVFTNSAWFAASIGAVAVVAVVGALTRLRTLPVAACLAVSVAGLLLYLNLIFERRHGLLFVIPTPASVSSLWHLFGAGFSESRRAARLPVPNLSGLLLLAAAGVGITAVLTDLIAVRLRSIALAGLPLLVLFTVPVMVNAPHSQLATGLVFCLGGAGYLAMLSADGRERIRVWGRLVSLWRPSLARRGAGDDGRPASRSEQGPDTRALAAAGRRVGLASIVLALCAPLLLPSLHAGKLLTGPGIGNGTSGGGSSSTAGLPVVLGQTITDQREPAIVVLNYTTNASQQLQKQDPQYLQSMVSDTLTSEGWLLSGYGAGATRLGAIPPEPGLTDPSSFPQVHMSLHAAADFTSRDSLPVFLPVPDPPTGLTAPGVWMVDPDFMVYSGGGSIANQTYTVTSRAVDPTAAQLSSAPAPQINVSADLALPTSYRLPALLKLAEEITRGQRTEYAKVYALQEWFADTGHYQLSAPAFDNAAGLVSFLAGTRSGVCVQFAWAMTVLTRLLGIPARLAVGFTAGTQTSRDHYVVSTRDNHAWPEVYFQGYGWLRFEPTPGSVGTASIPNYAAPSKTGPRSPGTGTVGPSPGPTSTLTVRPPHDHYTGGGGSTGSTSPAGIGPGKAAGLPWVALVLAVLAAIVLAAGILAMLAPPARSHRLSAVPVARRRRLLPVSSLTLLSVVAAVLAALALYRLLSHASGLTTATGWATVGLAFAIAAATVLLTPSLARIITRRWRWMHAHNDTDRAHAAWREFHDDLADFGITSPPSEPPRTLAARITAGLPEPASQPVRRLALAEERARYAATPAGSQTLHHDSTAARRTLATTATRPARWRARILPASVITTLADTTTRLPDHLNPLTAHLTRLNPLTRRRTQHHPTS